MEKPSNSHSDERSRRQTHIIEPAVGYNKSNISEPNIGDSSISEMNIETQSTHELTQGQGQLLTEDKQRSLSTYNHITYLLYVLSYFTAGLLWIVPIVMNYAKRHDADNTWLATHFDWQIKTFWYSLVLFAISIIIITFALSGLGVSVIADSGNLALGSILLTGLGLLIMVFTFVWHLYRIVRGWIALTDNRPVP